MIRQSSKEVCPGEQDCGRFQRQSGDKLQACIGCELVKTKPDTVEGEEEKKEELLLESVEELLTEVNMGYPPPLSLLTPLQFEVLKTWFQGLTFLREKKQEDTAAIMGSLWGIGRTK